MATLGVGRWAGSFARAGPAGGGATPGFNPNALSLAETVEAAGGAAAETSTFDKIMEVIRRSVQNRVWEDASSRTNRDRKLENGSATQTFRYSTADQYQGHAVPGAWPVAQTPFAAWATVVLTILALPGDTTSNQDRIYVTYTRRNPDTGQVYSGRTSGIGDPQTLVQQRGLGQQELTDEGFDAPRVDVWTNDRAAIRGREQMLIDHYGGAQSVGGTSRNAINGVWDWNPNRPDYMNAARRAFGPLIDNSPPRARYGD